MAGVKPPAPTSGGRAACDVPLQAASDLALGTALGGAAVDIGAGVGQEHVRTHAMSPGRG